MKHLYYLLLLGILNACSSEFEIEQLDYEPKVVVDGWIENNGQAKVYLTYSSPFLTQYDSTTIRETFLNNAKVTLSTDDETEILTLYKEDNFFPPFIYKSNRILGQEGQSYTIDIEVDNKIITSTTTIPKLPHIDKVKMNAVSDTASIILATINDPVEARNYYYLQIFNKNYSTQFHATKFPMLNDRDFNGEQHTVQISRKTQPDPFNTNNFNSNRNLLPEEFGINDTVYVKISTLDKTSFEVLNGIYIDLLNNANPFSFISKKTATNIEGGIGRWTGFASVTYLVYLNQESAIRIQ